MGVIPKERDELARARHPFHGYCRCGACVWDCPERAQQPRYSERLTCWNCGRDCSRRPFPGYYLWRGRRAWHLWCKRRRIGWQQLCLKAGQRWL